MPLPNFHACRLVEPNKFQPDSMRTTKRKHDGKEYSVVMGKLKGETTMTEQAYRYDKNAWSAAEAGKHCRDHDGKFEAAKKKALRILIKSNNVYEVLDEPDLIELFRKNMGTDGTVKQEFIVFTDVTLKQEPSDDSIRWTLSDYSVDRDQERIDPAGWDLRQYRQNPVVLWAHDYTRPAIGKVIHPRVKDAKLTGKVQFSAKEVDEFGWMIGQKVREGILTSGSVGFRSHKIEIVEDKNEPARLIHRKQELYEFSIVNIAANPAARVERQAEIDMEDDAKTIERNNEHEKIESEIAGLARRIADLEKAACKSKSYIGELMDYERVTSASPDRETSGMDDLFQKQTDIEEIF